MMCYFHILTLVRHKKPRLTAKCMVRHKKARFDIKCPVRYKKALPSMHQLTLPLSNTPLSCEKYIFQFYSNILFSKTHREMKMKLYWYEFKYIQYHCEISLKCNYSFLFGMTIMSAAINKCYRYGRIILPIFAFSFDCSIKIWYARS